MKYQCWALQVNGHSPYLIAWPIYDATQSVNAVLFFSASAISESYGFIILFRQNIALSKSHDMQTETNHVIFTLYSHSFSPALAGKTHTNRFVPCCCLLWKQVNVWLYLPHALMDFNQSWVIDAIWKP